MIKQIFFYNFQWVLRTDLWVRRHISVTGIVVLSFLIIAAVFGIDTRQSLAYQLFSLLFSLLFIAAILSFFQTCHFRFKRHLPRFSTVGQPLVYEVKIKNLGKKNLAHLLLHEQLYSPLPSFQAFQSYKKNYPEYFNWFDRHIGYPQWRDLVKRQQGGFIDNVAITHLPSQKTQTVKMCLEPQRRGIIYFKHMSLLQPEPLGLIHSVHTETLSDSVVILPKRYPVPPLKLHQGRRFLPGGISQVSSVGDSTEFMSLREYKPGDPWQHIHWKSWARQGKPIVKEFQDEFFVRAALILDTFAQHQPENYFEAAVSIASSCVEGLSHQDSLLDLMFMGTEAHCFTSGRGLGEVDDMLELLACVQANFDKNIDSLYPLLTQYAEHLSACVCVFLTWDPAREKLLKYLDKARISYRCFIICAEFPEQKLPAHCYYLRHHALAEDLTALDI